MDHAEQELISNLAERIRAAQPVAKDPQAAEAVQRLIATQPDALYVLTQAVLLQEHALQQAQAQIAELNGRLAHQGAGGGGFLSNLFGKPAQTHPPSANPGQPAAFVGAAAPAQPRGRGHGASGFLAAAASTAVGVAGGQMLFEGLSHAFGGHGSHGSASAAYEPPEFYDYDDDDWWRI